uniref:Uncharacterized protein n=1 Tax=Mustela putorius furo TaxID=9669 RepID=M3Y9G3_MUSPF
MRQSTAANSRRSGLEGGPRKVSAASEGGRPQSQSGEREITSRWKGSQREREREEEAGSPLSREPDAGLDSRTLRS